jgi:3'-phosphoadenosine 5'-phosphosulfate sulfotransferase (PAPS reductase)/FAD synthetase
MKYIISYSGGLGSFMAAYETVKRHGKENAMLVFTDTKTEDEDLYRFLRETSDALGVPLTILADGRNIWEVFTDVKFQGNNRIDPCSRILKRDLFRKWMESNFSPDQATLVVGISKDEAHRMNRIVQHWAPYSVIAPLCETPKSREQILDVLDELNILPPRLYEQGFPHNNCGGFCVKTGQRQMKMLLEKNPERYMWHEEQQEKLFKILGKRHGFIRKVVDGETQYLGMKEFRELVSSGEKLDLFVDNGCGCFV